jgi:hypothetical protein
VGEGRQLVTQEQVLGDQIGAAAQDSTEAAEKQHERFEHPRAMSDPEPGQRIGALQVHQVSLTGPASDDTAPDPARW